MRHPDLETLKNAGRAVFDVTAFQEALAAVPTTERSDMGRSSSMKTADP